MSGTERLAAAISVNAHATGGSYGWGRACVRGNDDAGGTSCRLIAMPANALPRPVGEDWQRDREYWQERRACVQIVLPDHVHSTEDTFGSGWVCDRGFTASADACVRIALPENGYLTNVGFGAAWACDGGFAEHRGRCDAVVWPSNAFLDSDSFGPGWRCERSYEPGDEVCVGRDLPDNAHLDRSGNRWRCDPSFQRTGEERIRGR